MRPKLKDRQQNFKQRMSRLFGTDRIPAKLGDGKGVIIDPLLPLTNVNVRVQSSNGLSTKRSAILPSGAGLQMYDGEPIWLGYDHKRRYVVIGPNVDDKAAAGQPAASVASALVSPSVPQANLETLRLIAKSGLTVSLKSWNIILNNVYYEFQFPDIDLTSSVPSAGQMRYALIAVLSDLSGVEVKNSTARSVSALPLDSADVNEAVALMTAGSTPTWAVKLVGGQTAVTQQNIDNDAKDLRQLVNSAQGGGAGGVVGPASSIIDHIATYADTSGKVIKDSAVSVHLIMTMQAHINSLTTLVNSLQSAIAALSTCLPDVLEGRVLNLDPLQTCDPIAYSMLC